MFIMWEVVTGIVKYEKTLSTAQVGKRETRHVDSKVDAGMQKANFHH
jgi:hypothetical protein